MTTKPESQHPNPDDASSGIIAHNFDHDEYINPAMIFVVAVFFILAAVLISLI